MTKRDACKAANWLERMGWPTVRVIKYERSWRVYADSIAFDRFEQVEERLKHS